MLHRREADGVVLISQPAHSWVAGQLARWWGNPEIGEFEPAEEVRLAAALHDIGFLNWEQAPTLNPETGLPHCFRDMPTECHFDLWSKSVQKMMRYGRYAALLVSLHFTGLSKKHRVLNSPREFELKRDFLNAQEEIQTTLLTSLQNDFYYGPFATPENLERNRLLLSVWDWISLALCLGFEGETSIEDVPAPAGQRKLSLFRDNAKRVIIDPWPFDPQHGKQLRVLCEGRRLLTTFKDEQKMREAIRAASPTTILIDLVPK